MEPLDLATLASLTGGNESHLERDETARQIRETVAEALATFRRELAAMGTPAPRGEEPWDDRLVAVGGEPAKPDDLRPVE